MDNRTILIVDNDQAVRKALCKVVKTIEMNYVAVSSGKEALEALASKHYDLILMAINMDEMDGFEAIQRIRKQGHKLPIIIVSERTGELDAVYGLDIGADDYVTKPFNPVILGAKIKALIRRNSKCNAVSGNIIMAGPFTYDSNTLRFYKNDQEIFLTAKENSMMKLFVDNVNRVFTKSMLYDLVWGNELIDENAIMVYINHLRAKIEDDPSNPRYIQTIKGLGYRFVI